MDADRRSTNRVDDETSRALVAAARHLLATEGADALTVRRIASAAGMSTMNVYSRFGGKDGVIDELYADGYRRLLAEVDAVPSTDDVPADLRRIAATYRSWALEHPRSYGVMFRSTVPSFSPSPESIAVARSGLVRLVERIEAGQRAGQIVDREPHEVAAWLWATCHGMISLELDGVGSERVDWSSVYDHGVRTAVNGLHPSVAPTSVTG